MKSRIWVAFIFFVVFYSGILIRLFYWQVIASPTLKSEAASQHFYRFTLPAKRGSIISSDGFPLVMNQDAFLVYGEPKVMKDIEDVSRKVGEILEMDTASISAALRQEGRLWVPIKHKVEAEKEKRLKELALPGIGFEPEPKRYYPEGSSSAHLLGFVGLDSNGMDKGYFGLEGFYDRELRGKDGSLRVEKDVRGNPILIGQTVRVEPEDGRSLILWLDRSIQAIAEKRLLEGIQKYGAKEGSVVIMDPFSGGIVAMAAYPSYDPRLYGEYDKDLFKNPIVGSTYEPGSTFKALVMGSAINQGVVSPDTTMDESGPVEVGGYSIRTWDNNYRGTVSMRDVLIHSSNVGMVFVQNKMGKDKFFSFLKDFQFGAMTNIDLEDENAPDLRPEKEWKDIDYATASFGQGIAVTPLQMVRAVSAIANGGYIVEPKIVRAYEDGSGKRVAVAIKKIKQVLGTKAVKEITEMLVETVDSGEAKWAKPKGYRIAGKTGTAQIPVAGHYDDKKTIASFIGFAPADNPRFVMLVTLREPSSSQWGSETAAPLFFTIAKDLFLYWGIPSQM